MSDKLFAAGYIFKIDVNGDERAFHSDVVCRQDGHPTSIHFNGWSSVGKRDRITFGIHLPPELWRPAKEAGLESICRKAISQALRNGWFDVDGHHEYEFDEHSEHWTGDLKRA
ncbi:hypothetical protein [Burkholderia dolosa]|uniref:hypothetical protein n=1 Tax=Burkholderia dolosa TaxID=152500 RepID=UPI002655E56D|nr:hypothetical protein [Burkholderia dolosa]MDN7419557.1 hypothetical protein [Burkholderia dolosa]